MPKLPDVAKRLFDMNMDIAFASWWEQIGRSWWGQESPNPDGMSMAFSFVYNAGYRRRAREEAQTRALEDDSREIEILGKAKTGEFRI